MDIKLYRSFFNGRTDVFARFWHQPDTGKSGYAPVYRLNKTSQSLTDVVILSHLSGQETIGIYPLLADNTTNLLALDFDNGDWLVKASDLISTAKKFNLAGYLECSRSGNGGHVWFFFRQPVFGWQVRALGKFLLSQSGQTRGSFDRLFPGQDEHSGKKLGNLICLPLQGNALESGRTAFIDPSGAAYPDQWQYLRSFVKISLQQINEVLNQVKVKLPTVDTLVPSPQPEKIKVITTDSPIVKLILSNQIFIPQTFLPDKLYKFLKANLNFPNPEFQELTRRGYSTWQTPRWLKNIEINQEGILIPAGFFSEIQKFSQASGLKLIIDDQQIIAPQVSFKSQIKLRPEQKPAVKEIMQHDRVILEAAPAFGKTIVALNYAARRHQSTLVIVHTRSLLQQWLKQIKICFDLKPEDIGVIGENKFAPGRKITVASYYTLAKRDLADVKDKFGVVVVDECHHVPAKTFTHVVKNLPAKYFLGLTATAFRRDRLERLMNFYLGPVIKPKVKIKSETASVLAANNVTTQLLTRQTRFELNPSTSEFNEIANQLIHDDGRNQQIVNDLAAALQQNLKCLVLTERVEHCQILLSLLRKNLKSVQAAAVSGRITRKQRRQLFQRVRQERFQLLIATGKLLGEGFDWPELTHLFLAFPFSWKGKLIQYLGRVQREDHGKKQAMVYDYVDVNVPMLKLMYWRRLRTYRNLGLAKIKLSKTNKVVSKNQMELF